MSLAAIPPKLDAFWLLRRALAADAFPRSDRESEKEKKMNKQVGR